MDRDMELREEGKYLRLKPTEMFCGSTSFMVAMADLRFIAALVLASLVLNSVEGRYNSRLELHGSRRELPRELSSAVAPPVDQHRQQLRLDNGLAATPPMGCGSSCAAHCIPFQFLFVVLSFEFGWSSSISSLNYWIVSSCISWHCGMVFVLLLHGAGSGIGEVLWSDSIVVDLNVLRDFLFFLNFVWIWHVFLLWMNRSVNYFFIKIYLFIYLIFRLSCIWKFYVLKSIYMLRNCLLFDNFPSHGLD